MCLVQEFNQWFSTRDWTATAQLIATFSVGIGLIVNGLVLRHHGRTREGQLFYQVIKDVRELEEKYYKEYAGKGDKDKQNWLSLFFGAYEYLAFLINKKHLKGDYKEFFTDETGFIAFYEGIFINQPDKTAINDPKQYAEIKKLYKTLRGKRKKDVLSPDNV
jgi:hypothetical protein